MRVERGRPARAEAREATAAALRERLRAADEETEVPAGLWERVREPDVTPSPSVPRPRTPSGMRTPRRPGRSVARGPGGGRPAALRPAMAVVVAAAVAVACVAFGVWWLVAPGTAAPPSDGSAGPASHAASPPSSSSEHPVHPWRFRIRVHNVERPCRSLHTQECALRLAKDPYGRYAAGDNAAGHVWHGDVVAASCVVTDATLVTDEKGLSSTRWYRVRTPGGTVGWLPGVRTRNSTKVPVCHEADRTARPRVP